MKYNTIISSHIFGNNNPDSKIQNLHDAIVWKIRAPRILLALIVGGGLSVSGAVFQGCLRNPLVDPYILGVSSGAAFGAALGIVFPIEIFSIQILAFVFGSLAVAIAYLLATNHGENSCCITDTFRGDNRLNIYGSGFSYEIYCRCRSTS